MNVGQFNVWANSPLPELPQPDARSTSVRIRDSAQSQRSVFTGMVLEQIARLGATVVAPSSLRLDFPQPSVHLPYTDLQQLPLHFRRWAKVFADTGIQEGNNAFNRTDQGYQRLPIPPSTRPVFSGRQVLTPGGRGAQRCFSGCGPFISSHTSGCIPRWRKTRSRSPCCPSVPPSDIAHRLHADIPTAPCSLACHPHLPFWLDYILNGATP
jgi:hypothetical protein